MRLHSIEDVLLMPSLPKAMRIFDDDWHLGEVPYASLFDQIWVNGYGTSEVTELA